MNKVFGLFLPLLFASCVKSSMSLHYEPRREGISLQQFARIDSLKVVSLGTYSRKAEDIASLYEINSHYTLLIVKVDSATHVVPQISTSSAMMPSSGRFSTITQSFSDFNIYDGAASTQGINTIKLLGDHVILTAKSSKTNNEIFFTSFKKLIIQFDSDPSKIMTMTSASWDAEDQVELTFVERNDILYLVVLSANDARHSVKQGQLERILNSNPSLP